MATETEIAYGKFSHDFAKLPLVSQVRLAQYGLAHLMGNQQASKVVAWVEGREEGTPEPSEDAKAEKKAEFQKAAWEHVLAGTIPQRAAAQPKATPREKIMSEIAKREVVQVLTDNGLAFPKGKDGTVNLRGEDVTGATLIERYLVKHGERIGKEADAELKRRAKAAEAAKATSLEDAF